MSNIDTSKAAVEKVAKMLLLNKDRSVVNGHTSTPWDCKQGSALLLAISAERDAHKAHAERLAAELERDGTFADGVEAAAKATCPMCEWGQPIDENGYHQPKIGDEFVSKCQALHIRALTPPTSRERDDEWAKALVKFVYRTIPGLWEINDVAAASVIEAFTAQYKGKEG